MKTFAGVLKQVMSEEGRVFLLMNYGVQKGLLQAKLEAADLLIKSLRQFAYHRNEELKWNWRLAQICICNKITNSIYFPTDFAGAMMPADQGGVFRQMTNASIGE